MKSHSTSISLALVLGGYTAETEGEALPLAEYVAALMSSREMVKADEVAADSLEYVDDNLLLQAACTQEAAPDTL